MDNLKEEKKLTNLIQFVRTNIQGCPKQWYIIQLHFLPKNIAI